MRLNKFQKNMAAKMGLLAYIQLTEPSELLEISGGGYRLKSRPTLLISKNGFWNWKDQGNKRKSALDYLVEVKNYSPENATVQILRLCQPEPPVNINKDKGENLYLPRAAGDNSRLENWLLESGIEEEITDYCFKNKLLYQEKRHNNAVFIGRDGQGEAHYVLVEAIDGSGFSSERFTNSSYGFLLHSPQEVSEVKIFESPLEALTEASLSVLLGEDWRECDRLAVGGLPPDEAAGRYFKAHPKIESAAVYFKNSPERIGTAQKLNEPSVFMSKSPDSPRISVERRDLFGVSASEIRDKLIME
jgi:hypothetical protein